VIVDENKKRERQEETLPFIDLARLQEFRGKACQTWRLEGEIQFFFGLEDLRKREERDSKTFICVPFTPLFCDLRVWFLPFCGERLFFSQRAILVVLAHCLRKKKMLEK